MNDQLHLEERIWVAFEMLNESPPLYDQIAPRGTKARVRLVNFTRQLMLVLNGVRNAVPPAQRIRLRKVARRG